MIDYEEDIRLKRSERFHVWWELTKIIFKGFVQKEDNLILIKLQGKYSLTFYIKAIREFVK